jgi:hypothetical protein
MGVVPLVDRLPFIRQQFIRLRALRKILSRQRTKLDRRLVSVIERAKCCNQITPCGFVIAVVLGASFVATGSAQTVEHRHKIGILTFGDSEIARKVSAQLASNVKSGFAILLDRDQIQAAARGSGYTGSLNLSLDQALDLGAAMGSDFYFLGDVRTLRRSPSEGRIYYESHAAIFLVSARTGKLVLWERPEFQRSTPIEAEQALLASLAAEETQHRYMIAIRRAAENEREARARAVEAGIPIIEVMSDDDSNEGVRAPRPPPPSGRGPPPARRRSQSTTPTD